MLTEPKDLIEAITGVWRSTLEATEGLAPSDWTTPTDCPGWSVQDQVAHVVTGHLIILQRLETELPELPDLPHVRHDFGKWFEGYVDVRRPRLGGQVRDEYAALAAEAAELLAQEGVLDEEIEGPAGARFPRGRFLPIAVFDHWVHEQDIRRALGRPGDPTSPAAGHSRDSMLNGLARLWSASAPAGTTVAFDVTGPGGRGVTMTLGDPFTVDDGLLEGADVSIAIPFAEFTALATGRADAVRVARELTIGGDQALATSLLETTSVVP